MDKSLQTGEALEAVTFAATEEQPAGSNLQRIIVAGRYGALLTACVATAGSLFFSDVMGLLPCVLCWYQRILMYPLVLLLAVGLLRHDRQIDAYVLPFSLLGMGTSLYHYLLVKTDLLPQPPCSVNIPCTVQYFNIAGFINIPFMALTAFLLITFAMALSTLDTSASGTAASSRYRAPLAVGSILVLVVGSYTAGAMLW